MPGARKNPLIIGIMTLVVAVFLCASPDAQSDEITTLNERIAELYRAGKYSEAISLAERSLTLTRARKGDEHLHTAARMGWLALLYEAQGRLTESEPLKKRALSIYETNLPAGHPVIAHSLNNLATLYIWLRAVSLRLNSS